MTEFTPFASTLGGVLIGLAAVILVLGNGRIAGISGIVSHALPPLEDSDTGQRWAFVAGLLLAPLVILLSGGTVEQTVSNNVEGMAVAGLLVGFGTVYGGGCTSGHGVCGLSRLSRRSLTATGVFMACAAITVYAARHVL